MKRNASLALFIGGRGREAAGKGCNSGGMPQGNMDEKAPPGYPWRGPVVITKALTRARQPSAYFSCTSRRRILPAPLLGRESTKTTLRGYL